MRAIVLAGLSSLLLASSAAIPAVQAQSFTTGPCESMDQGGNHWFSQSHACEVRHTTLPLRDGRLAVEGTNGGIEVVGEDRNDIVLDAQVSSQAHSDGEAQSILHDVKVLTDGTIRSDGPHYYEGRSWSVNYKLRVPRHLAAQLETKNGGIKLANLDGDLRAQTTNGSLTLANLGGDVRATTTNGSVRVELSGDTWHGAGLEARSTNGGVHVSVPSNYSAHLVAGTVNGGAHVNLPHTSNAWTSRNHVEADLGHGGPTLRMQTTNGGITVN